MKFIKLNKIVSYSEKPLMGKISGKSPVMALAIDKKSSPYKGIIRKITKRKGSVDISGYIDKSKLIIIESKDGINWKDKGTLKIKGIEKIINKLTKKDRYFIGLEDPDIITDHKGKKHVFYSIAFKLRNRIGFKVYLGHAKGKNLNQLKATKPVLLPLVEEIDGFKESCILPEKIDGKLYSLNEIMIYIKDKKEVSTISLSRIKKIGKLWSPEKILMDPKDQKQKWVKGHASPCCFLPIKHKRLFIGILNGREPGKWIKNKLHYGKFRPGLFLFDAKNKTIPWISEKPLLEDPKASTITFASDFLPLNKKEGLLYAHVNDSFVRAYKINLNELKKTLPKKF